MLSKSILLKVAEKSKYKPLFEWIYTMREFLLQIFSQNLTIAYYATGSAWFRFVLSNAT